MSSNSGTASQWHAMEAVSNLFEPDITASGSSLVKGRDPGLSGGERKLMAALLTDGIEAYMRSFAVEGECEEAAIDRLWVEERDPAYVFSFEIVCECLGLNPEYIRKGITTYVSAHYTSGDESAGANEKGAAKRKSGGAGVGWKRIRRPRK